MGLIARRAVLEESGYVTKIADTPEEALRHFKPGQFELIITDYRMPGMEGTELISRIRNLDKTVPIILISGFTEALGLDQANTGADIVLQKSSNEVSHLLRAVSRLLRKKPARKPPASEKPEPPESRQKGV
jgi:CheY-like chemotaxis protein